MYVFAPSSFLYFPFKGGTTERVNVCPVYHANLMPTEDIYCNSGLPHLLRLCEGAYNHTIPPTTIFIFARSPPICVCVFFPFILDIKYVGRTSRGQTGGR